MQKNPKFKHHPKCQKLGITHLSFADDVLMFCRGDFDSVETMMKGLNTFADTIGLIVNPRKCKVFFGGVDEDTKRRISALTSYDEGMLPFRQNSTCHNYYHCYGTILDALSSPPQGCHKEDRWHWMHCLPLPKAVIKKIDGICRSFVWTGKAIVSKKSPIAWESVCKPKNMRGMNIFNLYLGNDITLLKCLWNLSLKADNLWVKWVHAHYLKEEFNGV
ncbi:uncharacterized protein LOC131620044 [Vicia villosa]|uniref:uncharacterized protein LOC131620044 n=1 Tax=Vicia villosa TaxID=3911 RepID=UPI00273C8462|nr:uncharacterized protein LOC131620044 [Vicia villosa]